MDKIDKDEIENHPNIILAGAPKCGTTSVFDYLSGHPEICASTVKETYYLMDEGYSLGREYTIHKHGLNGYTNYFSHCRNAPEKSRLEATPDYLYQVTPIKEIPKWPDRPKVFFILRRPEERVYSLYRFAQNNISRIGKDVRFSQFINYVNQGEFQKKGQPILANAVEHSKYIIYLRRWREILGRENIGIFLFEDLVREPTVFMKQISDFLGIDPGYYDDFNYDTSNRTFSVRAQWLHLAKRNVSNIIPKGEYRILLAKIYQYINIGKPETKSTEDINELRRLHDIFSEPNKMLHEEFDIDLSNWH